MQIKKIIEMGILIEPVLAKELNQMPEPQFNTLLDKLTHLDAKPMVLDEILVKRLTAVPAKLIKQAQARKEMSMPELIAAWNVRFTILQKAVMRRPEMSNAVSIKNANGRCTIIGTVTVREKVLIEDPTGIVQLMLPSNVKVLTDDVIGVVGTMTQGIVYADEIFFPDIPLQQAKQTDVNISVGMQSDFILKAQEKEIDWFDCKGISVMICKLDEKMKEKFGAGEPMAQEILKRRLFGVAPYDAVEPVPDLIFIEGAEDFVLHHKGTTVVGFTRASRINMRDRTVEFGE